MVLKFLVDLLSQASILVALFTMVGLILLKKPINEIIAGSMKSLIGFILLGAGATVITTSLAPFGNMVEVAFNVQGVVPNNEAIVSLALTKYGTQVSMVMILSMIFHIIIAKFSPLKFIFLTGHHIFYMGVMITVILAVAGLSGVTLIIAASLINALAMSISPLLSYWAMPKVIGDSTSQVSLGHFSNVTYSISALIGKIVGGNSPSVEDLKLPKGLSFMRDNILAIALTMSIIYIIVAIAAGSAYIEKELSNGQNYLVFALIQGVTFAAGVSVVLSGVRMILGEIIPAFKGISEKIVPNAIPALDCPVVFPYAPNAVLIGFITSFIGGLVGLAILGAVGGVLIIPGVVPHFFVGATAGVFGNATGGRRGCIIGSFINGLLLAFLPIILLPILGDLGFQNTTFSDADFVAVGGIIGFITSLIK
ncbi:PTS system ascorbate-specific transporter subunit IIC [Brachyspira pilosicoli B2904]|uniref:Ascorbate-specific PTS system EIIC component n=1 Tax=Brachyspira pilosicoli B2904 TaxID=1133568 RepID=J9URK2_BRAPL|nr:PTS ascorbate transporter subunit IIC [Brachyspira pilosicoli]AFR69613.1 PTS system ascorbate-specific transporter subunit IIC [Brachyspira pilosicoli B2904]